MTLWMWWEITPIASAGQGVIDTAAAVRAFDVSVRRVKERALTSEESRMIERDAQVMRSRIIHEAAEKLSRGAPWSMTIGRITVTLTPRD